MQEGLRADPDIFLAAVFFLHILAKLVPALKRQRLLFLPVVSQLLQALSTGSEHGLSLGSTQRASVLAVQSCAGWAQALWHPQSPWGGCSWPQQPPSPVVWLSTAARSGRHWAVLCCCFLVCSFTPRHPQLTSGRSGSAFSHRASQFISWGSWWTEGMLCSWVAVGWHGRTPHLGDGWGPWHSTMGCAQDPAEEQEATSGAEGSVALADGCLQPSSVTATTSTCQGFTVLGGAVTHCWLSLTCFLFLPIHSPPAQPPLELG